MKENDWQLIRCFLLWLVLPFIVALYFMDSSVFGNGDAKLLVTSFSPLFDLHCYRQVASVITFLSDYSVKLLILKSLIRKEKKTCENCGTQTTRNNIVRHRKICSVGTLYFTQYLKFSTKSQSDLNCHIVKKHSAPKPHMTFKCKFCYKEFPGFYA